MSSRSSWREEPPKAWPHRPPPLAPSPVAIPLEPVPAWAAADALLEMGGRAVEGMITGQAYDLSDQSPAFLAFKQAYQQRFGQSIDTAAVTAYNATQVLLHALRERQPQESLKQTLLRIRHFASLQQPIDLDEFGDSASRFYLMVVRQGRFINAE